MVCVCVLAQRRRLDGRYGAGAVISVYNTHYMMAGCVQRKLLYNCMYLLALERRTYSIVMY